MRDNGTFYKSSNGIQLTDDVDDNRDRAFGHLFSFRRALHSLFGHRRVVSQPAIPCPMQLDGREGGDANNHLLID